MNKEVYPIGEYEKFNDTYEFLGIFVYYIFIFSISYWKFHYKFIFRSC